MQKNHIEFLAQKYNSVLIKVEQRREQNDYYLGLLKHGIVCDFEPDAQQLKLLEKLHEPINIKNTLFTFNQAVFLDVQDKIQAQISEYILSYRFGGAFIRSRKKTTVETRFITGITKDKLETMLKKVIVKPMAMRSEDVELLSEIISEQLGTLDFAQVKSNELKVKLLSKFLDKGERIVGVSGDDLMRFVVMKYTGSTLLIKSRGVLDVILESPEELVDPQFYFDYAKELAPCFNRLKPIMLALRKKSPKARKAINKISRMSKHLHKPVGMPRSRTFLADMYKGNYEQGMPEDFTVFDWFRILNAIAVKQAGLENDVFQVRNGKVWYQPRDKQLSKTWLKQTEGKVLERLAEKLNHLKAENIKLPNYIRLGLPITEKQSIGALPFGTVISTKQYAEAISLGIYWENSWGAHDLDLSIINISGQRTGWGNAASYQREDIIFSGDITNAPEGAMEFMTVNRPTSFGLFVNIYSGAVGCRCKLVIGSRDRKNAQWIDDVYIGEMTQLNSRGNVIGFLNPQNEYIVYQGRLGSAHTSSPSNKAIVDKALVSLWTLDRLFSAIGLHFDKTQKPTIDLSYDSISFDKLAQLCLVDYGEHVA